MNLYQDVTETETEIVVVDATVVVDVIQVLYLEETTAVYGSFYSSSSVEDAAEILLVVTDVADVAAMTAVSGLSFFSSSAEDAETIHVVTTVVDATIAAANKRNLQHYKGICS